MVRSLLFVGLLCVATVAVEANAEGPIVGEVEGGEFRPFPLAVTKMRLSGGSDVQRANADLLIRVVRSDLEMSGAFQLLDEKSFIDSDVVGPAAVKFPDWQTVGAQGLVKTALTLNGKDLSIEFHAYEVAAQKEVGNKTILGNVDDVRGLAHSISDEIFRSFTGEPGAFRTKIAVVKKVQGEKHVFVIDVDGEGARQITNDGGLNLLPGWSPDGKSLLYTSYRYDNPDLFEKALGGGDPRPVSRRVGLNTGGRVSPDGNKIAVTLSQDGNSELYLLDRAGNVVKRLTNQWGIDTSPSWSPDASQITFVSSRGGHPDLYLMDVASGSSKRITFKGDYNQTPSFSPRGTHIAFTARDERNAFDIFVLNIKTGEVKRVTQNQGNNEEPSFSPNGRLLVFTTTRNKTRQLVISNVDGSHQTVLPSMGDHTSPAWGPFVR